MVHGLLTATIPTKLGGDLNFLAREMYFEFIRPVWVGEIIRCEATLSSVVPEQGRTALSISMTCRNQHGKEVLRGHTSGVILDVLKQGLSGQNEDWPPHLAHPPDCLIPVAH